MEERENTIPNTQEENNLRNQEISKEDMATYEAAIKYKKGKKARKKLVLFLVLIAAIVGLILIRGSYLTAKDLGEKYLQVYNRKTLITSGIFFVNFFLIYFIFIRTNKLIKRILANIYKRRKSNAKICKQINCIHNCTNWLSSSNSIKQKYDNTNNWISMVWTNRPSIPPRYIMVCNN